MNFAEFVIVSAVVLIVLTIALVAVVVRFGNKIQAKNDSVASHLAGMTNHK